MYNHEPENYHCPFCSLATGVEDESIRSRQADIIYKDSEIMAFIASDWWPNNPGHVLVSPIKHIENIYDLPEDLAARVAIFGKRIALALKETYKCDGVSLRQHNEPAGDQDVWHYHVHIFPRFAHDHLYELQMQRGIGLESERKAYAARIRDYLDTMK